MKIQTVYFVLAAIVTCIAKADATNPENESVSSSIEIQALGIAFTPIKDWHLAGRQAIVKNLNRYEFDDSELSAILSTHKRSLTLASFMRSDPRVTAGIIPTVNVIANPVSDTSESAVRAAASAVIETLRQATQNVVVIEEVTPIPLSEVTAFRFIVEFEITPKGGSSIVIRNQTYIIPREKILVQVSMSEAKPPEQDQIFQSFIKSFKITK